MTCLLTLIEQNPYSIPADTEMISRFVVIRPQAAYASTGHQENSNPAGNAEKISSTISIKDGDMIRSNDARGKAKSQEMLI